MSRLTTLMEQVKKLKNGVGIQSLLDASRQILGNPIAMFNTEYNLLAYTEVATDDPIWNELIALGTFTKETQKLFDDEGFIEDMANAARITLMTSKKLKYDRIGGKLFNKNNSYVSNLVIVACEKPFEDEDALVFEAVCKLISREISRSAFYQEYEQAHQEMILKNLIDGNYDTKLDMGQVGILYDTLASSLYIAVVDISQRNPDCTDMVSLRDLLRQTQPAYKYAIYGNEIILIISTDEDTLHVNKALKELIHVFEAHNLYAGISGKFENLFELQKYYAEALRAMQFAAEVKSSQRIFPCDERSRGKMERIKELKNGEGIQYFLDVGAEILGNPLLFHDMELNLLGYSKNMEIADPIWQELITYGTGSCETIALFRTEGFIDIMDNAMGGALLISEKIKYDRISWRIYNSDNIRIGCTSIVNTMKPFSEDALVLFGAFSKTFSKEVGKIEFYSNYGQVYSETVINRLISGKIDNDTFYSEDIGSLYDNLMENLYLIVVDTARCDSGQVNLTYLKNLFHRFKTVTRYAVYSNYIIIIISTDRDFLHGNSALEDLNGVFARENIYAGISSCFENIYDVQKYYNEAVGTLQAGMGQREQGGRRHIFRSDRIRAEA